MNKYEVLDINMKHKYNITARSLDEAQNKLGQINRHVCIEFIKNDNRIVSMDFHIKKTEDLETISKEQYSEWLNVLDYYLFNG